MNVIVSNKQKNIIDNANIDAIKDFTGLFNVDDLIAKFKNYFFSKMILDVTSVENFTSREVLQKLVDGIGSDRLIILLPETPPPPNEFKKMLIDLKIYNFSNNINDVVKFIDNPNTYENAIKGMDDAFYNNDGYVDNSIKDLNNSFQSEQVNDNLGINDSFNSSASLQSALDSFDIKENNNVTNNEFNNDFNGLYNVSNDAIKTDGYNYNDSYDLDNNAYNIYNDNDQSDNMAYDIPNLSDLYNISNNGENDLDNSLKDNENNDSYNALLNNSNDNINSDYLNNDNKSKSDYVFLNVGALDKIRNDEKKIIGFRNVTEHAGSTSLIYMILKEMNDNMKKDVLAVEINKDDFKLFMNSRMVKVLEKDINQYLSERYERIILVDLNDCVDTSFCDDIIYLIEPSTVMLNKLMLENRDIFKELSNQKVVLNKSMLSKEDVGILSNEAGMKFIYNIGPLNDRMNNKEIVNFIDILGLK